MEILEKLIFSQSLQNPEFFNKVIRPELYKRYKDPEIIHELSLEILNKHQKIIDKLQYLFNFPQLEVNINGNKIIPIGIAAGFDKNGDALIPLSKIFGFLEPGTVTLDGRLGNNYPRILIDEKNERIYNAQGFPSKGLSYFKDKLLDYRLNYKGKTPVYVSICGIPPKEEEKIDKSLTIAWEETILLLESLGQHIDGIVWNPFSPNTESLKILRTEDLFKQYAQLIKEKIGNKLKLVKIGPCSEDKTQEHKWLNLIKAWLDGGGDGIVAVNTLTVEKKVIPTENWGYHSAGLSGKILQPYMLKALHNTRANFQNAIIFATGGIDNGDIAYNAFKAGADAIEGYTPYTFHGLGLVGKIMIDIYKNLKKEGFETLEQLINSLKENKTFL